MAKYFNIRFLSGKKWMTSTYKMTEETARERFGHTQWEVIPHTVEERKGQGQTMGHVLRGPDGK